MKKILALFIFFPPLAFAWMGLGGGIDYSRDAGNSYYCANPSGSAVTTQAGVSISSPTLSLFNPNGSGKNLVILDVGVTPTTIPAAQTEFFLAYNVTPSSGTNVTGMTSTTPILSTFLVGKSTTSAASSGIGVCRIQGYLPALPLPVAFRYIGAVSSNSVSGIMDQTNGKVVLPPGALISIQASAAVSVLSHISWREESQ